MGIKGIGKKILSLALATVMVFSVLPANMISMTVKASRIDLSSVTCDYSNSNGVIATGSFGYTAVYDGSGQKLPHPFKYNDYYLIEGTDYTVQYSNNINVGTATATYTGIGNYTGTRTLQFTIRAMHVRDDNPKVEVTPNFDWPIVYDGGTHDELRNVIVKVNGVTLTNGTDYDVSYTGSYSYLPTRNGSRRSENFTNDTISALSDGVPKGNNEYIVDFPIQIDFKGNYSSYWKSTEHYATDCQYRIMPHLDTERTVPDCNGWSWTLGTDGTLNVSGSGNMPNDVSTSSNGWRYDYARYIKMAVVTGSATSVAAYAFSDAVNLVDVELPNTVETIGEYAFGSCRNLKSIHTPGTNRMPESLHTVINHGLGNNTYNLEVHLPDNITTFEINNAHVDNKVYCRRGTTTEATIKERGASAFYYLEGEEYDGFQFYGSSSDPDAYYLRQYTGIGGARGELSIPNFLTRNEQTSPFIHREWIRKLTIPASVEYLRGDAFVSMTRCAEMVIESGSQLEIPANMLSSHPDTKLTIPDSVTVMPSGGFSSFGSNHLILVVGEGSAAHNWAVEKGYTEVGGTGKLHYMLRSITQPYIDPTTASLNTASISDLSITKHDGSFSGGVGHFTFDSLKNGNTVLTRDTDYTLNGDEVTIKSDYLRTLGSGTHTITFHYTGTAGGGTETPVDPTFSVTISAMASPSLTVSGNGGANITNSCDVVWKKTDGTVVSGNLSVPTGTTLIYTITPRDSLKVGDVQYYKTTTGRVTLTSEGQAVNVNMNSQGSVTVIPQNGSSAIPNEYTVKWYTLKNGNYTAISSGVTSPVKDTGTELYYDIIMTGSNQGTYHNIEKALCTIGYGNVAQNLDLNATNYIQLNISRADGVAITEDDYTVAWYKKDTSENFIKAAEGNPLKYLSGQTGNKYYYEITPRDYKTGGTIVYNWLKFNGIPVSNTTEVIVDDVQRTINVPAVTAVSTRTLNVTVTNAASVGAGNLSLSYTQTPWSGYAGGQSSSFSYSDEWPAVTNNGNGTFTATVYNFDTDITVTDSQGNFKTAYQTVKKADLANVVNVDMAGERLPESLALKISRTYPVVPSESNNNTDTRTEDLSNRYDRLGAFPYMEFTLKKGETVISSDLYTVTPTELRFTNTDSAYDAGVRMGENLTLEARFKDGTNAVFTQATSTLTVQRKYGEYGENIETNHSFSLAYTDYGNVNVKTSTGRPNDTYALYDSAGNLAFGDSKRLYYGVNSQNLAPGTYTLMVWRQADWANPMDTLAEQQSFLSEEEYLIRQVTIANGRCTAISLGETPELSTRALFAEGSGFSNAIEETTIEEYTLIRLSYEVDSHIAAANPGATYAFTVKTSNSNNNNSTETVALRCEEGRHPRGAQPVSDKYISVYSDGVLADSRVSATYAPAGNFINGFTLYTEKACGVIYFYVKSPNGGDYPITAKGALLNSRGSEVQKADMGSMTLSVSAQSSALSFTSDYLRASDNGSGTDNYNGVWIYTVPNKNVTLYMDDIEIAETRANGIGVASFSFAMNRNAIGSARTNYFRANDPAWTLFGTHELRAETAVDGDNIVSATAEMECVSKNNFTPAVLTRVEVAGYSDDEREADNGDAVTLMNYDPTRDRGPAMTQYYWSLSRGNVYSYTFTATLESAATVMDEIGLVLYVTGQDGIVRPALMERVGDTNSFEASVSGEKFLFTNWSIGIRSKVPTEMHTTTYNGSEVALAGTDDIDITDLKGDDTVVSNPVSGADTTMGELRGNMIAELSEGTADAAATRIRTELRMEMDACAEVFKELEPFGEIDFPIDGSEESMEKLLEYCGYSFGKATDPGVNYESWGNDYKKAILADGREMRVRAEYTENGNRFTSWAVILPTELDPDGALIKQDIYMHGNESGLINTEASINSFNRGVMASSIVLEDSYKGAPILTGNGPNGLPQFNDGVAALVNGMNTRLKKAYQKYSGNLEGRADYQYINKKKEMLNYFNIGNNKSERQNQYNENRTMRQRIDDLLAQGNISPEARAILEDCAYRMDYISTAAGNADMGYVCGSLLEKMMDISSKLKKATKLSDMIGAESIEGLETAFEEYFGVSITKGAFGIANKLLQLYLSGKLSDAEKELLKTLVRLDYALEIMGIENNVSIGGGGGIGTCSGSARATHDPEGIVYEAVLSNPVQGATATLWERAANGTESRWDAGAYGQVNPQVTNASGQYQWFVPEGEWQVRVDAPADRSDLSDNTSAGHRAANLDDGSTAGWLPVMPVQLGINIPLTSNLAPEVENAEVHVSYAKVLFSRYMKVEELTNANITIAGPDGNLISCTVELPDQDVDPADASKYYARTVRLIPTDGVKFDRTKEYTVSVVSGLTAYNDRQLASAFSQKLSVIVSNVTVTFDSDGGTEVASQIIPEGECATKPTDPTKNGYVFDYWMLDNAQYDFASPVYEDITLKAKWTQNSGNGSHGGSSGGGTSSKTTSKAKTTTETKEKADGSKTVTQTTTKENGDMTIVVSNVSAKGDTTSIYKYQSGRNKEISLVEVLTEESTVTVPAKVTANGVSYKVTRLKAGFLKNNKTVKKVIIGKNVVAIGKNAFKGDSKLKTVVIKGKLDYVGKNAFKGIDKKAVIKINASKKNYKKTVKRIKKSGIAKTVTFKRTTE
ncbi:MAG: leucine-rich repeat protein [Lachnospiraceae bacterium]|nr:leucine-rich repeat protein [Lachnospiraceae bacterium]